MRKTHNLNRSMGRHLLLVVAFLMTSALSFGQVTTSGMNGRVTDNNKELLPGATVIAIHQPSGTQYGTITNTEGRFNLTGMRAGGPYLVEVSYVGYSKETYSDITLFLGQTFVLNSVLKQGALELGEIMVVGKKASAFQTDKTGASTNISNQQLSTMPTISRGIQDVTRLSPYSNGMGFAGGDGRSTNFTVDGANFNNNFGLSSSLPGGGNPISLDAIEEVQVVVAPFDIRQSNFIGGGINAITKSGTNKFKGTAYTYLKNQDMRGNKIGDVDFGARDKASTKTYGLSLGGPIIKNKLFFFVNGEYELNPGQVVTWRPSEDGIANPDLQLSRASIADMESVKQHLISQYGYDPGSYTDYPADENNKKLMARLDWNINSSNKVSVRYNYTKNKAWYPTNGNSTDAGFRNNSMDRISQYSMAFSNSLYSQDNTVNSIAFDLNSRFSNKISNQFLATYTKITDMRGTDSKPFPFIDIMNGVNGDGSQILEPYISAGYELFTWNNGVNNNILNIVDNVNVYLNNHKITIGASFEHQMANNSYMRNGTGYYRYASLADFLNQAAPRDFAVTYGYDGEKNPAAEVGFNQIGLYAQDEWSINPNFKLSYGIRADYLVYDDNLISNNAISALGFGGDTLDTGKWPTAKIQVSPRVGFTWDVMGDQKLKVRGGSGLFAGRLPLVFFTNMPTNSGMVQGSYAAVTKYNADGTIKTVDPKLALLAGPMITDVNEMIRILELQNSITPEQGALPRDINAIDPNFKMPQAWKTSLALDYEIPVSFPLSVTVEGIFTKTINGVMLKNYDLKQPDDTWEHFSGVDDRYIYPAKADLTYNARNAYVLTNTNDGYGVIGNISIFAEPVRDLNLMFAYTYTESNEVSGMPGSNAASAYTGLFEIDGPHVPLAQRSQYVVPSKVIASASYKIPWGNDALKSATMVNLFYSGFTPYGNSFAYTNDMNGDGIATDLIYIPKNKGDIKFVSPEDEDAFFKFVDQDKYLSSHKGQYAEAYAARAPWVNRFDLRIAREYYFKVAGRTNTLQFSLDCLNVGNILNSEWGVYQTNSGSNNGRILKYEGRDTDNVPSFSMVKVKGEYPTETYSLNYNYAQVWQLQLGVRYIF